MATGKQYKGCQRYIDMWALPGVHPSNIELLQKLKTADTNHFTTHMDCVGTVSTLDSKTEQWEESHMVGLRTDVWKPDAEELHSSIRSLKDKRRREIKQSIKRSGRLSEQQKQRLEEDLSEDEIMQMQSSDLLSRRLVMKLFRTTGDRMSWVGTIEEVTTTEVHNSMGTKKSLLTMAVMLTRMQQVSYIQQNHRTFRIPSLFSFCFHDSQRMWNVLLRRHWVSIGADFDVEADGEAIGEVDGKLFTFGSDSHLVIDPHPLSEQTRFVDLMTLFAASVGYHRAMRRSVEARVQATLDGQWQRNMIEDEELRLRHNGRAAA